MTMEYHLRRWRGVALYRALSLATGLMVACSSEAGDSGAAPDGGIFFDAGGRAAVDAPLPEANVRVRFDLGRFEDGPLDFGSVPWPDNLYADQGWAPELGGQPPAEAGGSGADTALSGLDGFGLLGPVYFFFDGAIDADSLPASPQESLLPGASAFVLDVDTNSPNPFARVPVQVAYDKGEQRVSLAPARGHMFAPGRRYAAVVTGALRDADGEAVGAGPDFAAIRDGEPLASGDNLARAKDQIRGALSTLAELDIPTQHVIGLALFRTQSVVAGLEEAYAAVSGGEPAAVSVSLRVGATELDGVLGQPEEPLPGLDVRGGVQHGNIGAMVHGTLAVGNLLASERATLGAFERTASNEWLVKRIEDVPFTLFLPLSPADATNLPLVVFAHGWGRERSDALALADWFAASGMAVVALDAPAHGTRLTGADHEHRFVSVEGPDGFGDEAGDPIGMTVPTSTLPKLHPFLHRDLLRQWAIDHLELLRALDHADLTPLREIAPAYDELAFDTQRVAVVGMDMGATVALMMAAMSDSVGALVALSPGGHLLRDWLQSPKRQSEADAILEALGIDPEDVEDRGGLAIEPDPAFYQMLLDGAEPLAWASTVRRLPVNVMVVSAPDDEEVTAVGTETLARVLGAEFEPDSDTGVEPAPLAESRVSRILLRLSHGTHDALLHRKGMRHYATGDGGFRKLEQAELIDNPVDELLTNLGFFVTSWRACSMEAETPACAAQIQEFRVD